MAETKNPLSKVIENINRLQDNLNKIIEYQKTIIYMIKGDQK